MLNPVVQKAMEALTSHIDGGPGGEAAAASILEKLHTAGEKFEPEALAAWASLNGWTPKGVARIRRVASGVLASRTTSSAVRLVDEVPTESGVEHPG